MPRRDTMPTQQAGEYLVAAELARAGAICATFAGNVRHFDLIALVPAGFVPVQVKAKRSGDWQLNIEEFAEVSMAGDQQVIGAAKPTPINNLVYVFVHLSTYGNDDFFVIDWPALQGRIITAHREWLTEHGGRRPKNPASKHTTIGDAELADCRNRWNLITGGAV